MLGDQTSKKHKASRCFHVRDMFRAAILLSRTAQKSKIQTAYFQNKECYPAENKQADGNLYFLSCDEDKNPKLCLVMNFNFNFSKNKRLLLNCRRFFLWLHIKVARALSNAS